MNEDNVRALVSGFNINSTGTTQKERLHALSWLIMQEIEKDETGMTACYHRLDVLTRVVRDVCDAARGTLARHGAGEMPTR